MTLIAPSTLPIDLSKLTDQVEQLAQAGADWIHADIMDGSFVPPITFGPPVVKVIRQNFRGILDVHLMTEHPETHVEAFRDAGADIITVHIEVSPHIHRTIERIHALGAKAGVALNPGTSLTAIDEILPHLDLLLVMTVNPGWGAQSYIPTSTDKIKAAASLIKNSGKKIYLEVDGGINTTTAGLVKQAGADVLVAGTAILGSKDYAAAIASLR